MAENCEFFSRMEEDRLIDRQLSSKNFAKASFSDEDLDMTLDICDSQLVASL